MKKLDIDFSNLMSGKTIKQSTTNNEPRRQVPQLFGISLQIPSTGEVKDLVLCSPLEFSEWVNSVWPKAYLTSEELITVRDVERRAEIFNGVVNFNTFFKLHTKKKEEPLC